MATHQETETPLDDDLDKAIAALDSADFLVNEIVEENGNMNGKVTDTQALVTHVAHETEKKEKEKEYKERAEERAEDIQLSAPKSLGQMLSENQIIFDSESAKKFKVTGTFKTHWKEYVRQPVISATVMTHEGTQQKIYFAHPLAPRRIYCALKIKRISDVDNVRETYRCRFHIYFDWLLTQEGYESYVKYRSSGSSKKIEWFPPFRPRYEFLNIVEEHLFEEVDYGLEGPYRVQKIKDFASDMVGFPAESAYFCRMRLEVDATFCEELELENFPVDCQDFSVVMREGWGVKRAIFVPELRTKGGKPSDFARVDPSFSVLDEWEFHNSRIEFQSSISSESRSDTEYFMLTIRFKMRRRYSVYFWNIVIYMFAISLLSLSCFALWDRDIVGERMSLAITLLLTAVAFQYIIFDQLPNVAYLTLLHKYIISSFLFTSCVAVETSLTAISFVDWFESPVGKEWGFDSYMFIVFTVVFIFYNCFFFVSAAWLRHWESKKLYMDSEQLEEYIEETKHQFKMAWHEDSSKIDFRGVDGRIALFEDVDPAMEFEDTASTMIDNFCVFICVWICHCLKQCITCRCWKKMCAKRQTFRKEVSNKRREHTIRG